MSATREMSVVRMVFVLIAVALVGFPAQAKYGGGSGTAKDPWRIATKQDFLALAAHTDDYASHFILTADINLSGQTFTMAPIAPATKIGPHGEFEATPFTGAVDGNGHKITGLTITDKTTGRSHLGLFGCIARGGRVTNLTLERVSITGGDVAHFVGGLVGLNDGGTITHCTLADSVNTISGSDKVGALAGMNGEGGTITRCHALAGTTSGDVNIGGLIGQNARGGRIMDCDAAGTVTGEAFHFGGLVGFNEGTITRCHATGNVTGQLDLGGLVGKNGGIIADCYASGDISGSFGGAEIGGLVGQNLRGAIVTNSHATGSVIVDRVTAIAGGLAGDNSGLITHSYATGDVAGRASILGGLVGDNHGAIVCSRAAGNVAGVSGMSSYAGGLAGSGDKDEVIINCYATGSVTNASVVGGLLEDSYGTVTNCYATGKLTGAIHLVGGLVGRSELPGQTVNSFWDTQTTGQSKSAGGTGKTTIQMQTTKTFLDASWDFNCIWDIEEKETYPFLRPGLAGDLNCDKKVDLKDFARFAANWSKRCGVSTNPSLPLPKCPVVGDLNHDKTVDAIDLWLLATQWLDNRAQTVGQ